MFPRIGLKRFFLLGVLSRGFKTQLLANAHKEAEKNTKAGAVAKTAAAASAKDTEKPKPEAAAHCQEEEALKCKEEKNPNSGKKKPEKSLTSILAARSKAVSGPSRKSKETIVDIDETDIDNELAAVEYVEDIYKFYKLTEEDGRVGNYMDSQPDINSKMRSILVDWLVEVHKKFELMPECLYLTINIMDRFLSMKVIPRRELQLVGISSMLIACKYEEIWAPEVQWIFTSIQLALFFTGLETESNLYVVSVFFR